jgi:hypothetical protein
MQHPPASRVMDLPTADIGFKNPCISAYFVSFLHYFGVSRGLITDIENACMFGFNISSPSSKWDEE